jgi:exosortase
MQRLASEKMTLLIFLGAILLYLPTWLWLGEAWWSDPYYSHGPLVLIVALYFFWVRRGVMVSPNGAKQPPSSKLELPNSNPEITLSHAPQRLLTMAGNLGLLLILAALAVHLWATWWRAYYLSALTIPILFLGLFLALYGTRAAKNFFFPLAFLILMVPLPLAEKFGPMLEGWTAISATRVAQFIGVAATNDGAQVFLPNSAFTVGIPCGGLSSAIAIITLATLFAYIVQGPRLARAAIFFAAIPVALAANTFRLSLLFAIAQQWGAEIGMDYFHSWSSPVLFLFAFGLLMGLAYLLRCASVRWDAILPA